MKNWILAAWLVSSTAFGGAIDYETLRIMFRNLMVSALARQNLVDPETDKKIFHSPEVVFSEKENFPEEGRLKIEFELQLSGSAWAPFSGSSLALGIQSLRDPSTAPPQNSFNVTLTANTDAAALFRYAAARARNEFQPDPCASADVWKALGSDEELVAACDEWKTLERTLNTVEILTSLEKVIQLRHTFIKKYAPRYRAINRTQEAREMEKELPALARLLKSLKQRPRNHEAKLVFIESANEGRELSDDLSLNYLAVVIKPTHVSATVQLYSKSADKTVEKTLPNYVPALEKLSASVENRREFLKKMAPVLAELFSHFKHELAPPEAAEPR